MDLLVHTGLFALSGFKEKEAEHFMDNSENNKAMNTVEDNLLMHFQNSTEWLDAIVRSSQDAIIGKSLRGTIVSWNDAATGIYGYTAEEVIGQSVAMLVPEDKAEELKGFLQKIARGERIDHYETTRVRKDGTMITISIVISPVRDPGGRIIGASTIARDVTPIKKLQRELVKKNQELQYQAFHDTLTGLPNRLYFQQELEERLQLAKQSSQKFCVCFLDLDGFKRINDTLGHDIGDLLLQAVAERLKTAIRQTDFAARMGGDEFTLILSEIYEQAAAAKLAEKLVETIRQPYVLAEHRIVVTTSAGIAVYPEHGKDVQTLMKRADIAMYKAKKSGKNQYGFYDCQDGDACILG